MKDSILPTTALIIWLSIYSSLDSVSARKVRADIGICRSHDESGLKVKISCMNHPKVFCCPILSGPKAIKVCCTWDEFSQHYSSVIFQVSFMFILNVILLVIVIWLSSYGYYLFSVLPEIKVE